ncbi:hypothetical protein [Yinghuangia sp. YIM S10712]|uniref:hypothetical protein n=1 Tax=Yinghuangia sp. YIM S10712 TaxID=3436930 RepID=UPI003F53BC53
MADKPPPLTTWLRAQVRRKPAGDGDGTPGSGGGLRISRGLMVAIVLALVVVVVVLTSDNDGTPTTNAAESASPSAEASPSSSAADGTPSPTSQPAGGPPPTAAGGNPDGSKPVGTTGYTRNRQSLTVLSAPRRNSDVVATLRYDTPVTLVCHTEGPVVYGMNGLRSTLWDKITIPGGDTGYVPDSWIATEAETPTLVPAC